MTTLLRETRDGWSARVRIGQGARPWLPMPAMKSEQAEQRRQRLQQLATDLVHAGKHDRADEILRDCAKASVAAFESAERAARRLLANDPAAKPTGPRTFRDVAELWLTGELHRLYPDDVAAKEETGRQADRTMLSTFFPLLGPKLIANITRKDTDAAKLLVPSHLESSSRAVYLNRLRRVFRLALDPLELIETVPLRGKLPRPESDRDFWYLYPVEVEQLLRCVEIPIEYRLLYGFLAHNGTRIGETLRLTWAHIDWTSGVVRLEKSWTKTKRGRFWKLDPDVLRALRYRWEDLGKPKTGRIFIAPDSGDSRKVIDRRRLQERFIDDLKVAGITRPELLASQDGSRRLRLHDLRATTVTLARKVGMSDRAIMDRTGHETLGVLGKYERLVRHATELEHGWFAPLDECLYPEKKCLYAERKPLHGAPAVALNMDQRMDQKSLTIRKHTPEAFPIVNADGFSVRTEQPNSAAASRSNSTEQRFGPCPEGGVDQNADRSRTNPVLVSGLSAPQLEELLGLATKAKRWPLVTALGDALDAVAAGARSNVTRLDDRRPK